MKNRILALFLATMMLIVALGQITVFAEDPTQENAESQGTATSTIVGSNDTDWGVGSGAPTMTFAENGYTKTSGLDGWGVRSYYGHLVQLDGLELSFRATTNSGDCVGIVLANNTTSSYFGDGISITYWNNLWNSSQARLNFGTNHNYENDSVVYTQPSLESSLGFGIASSMVCNQGGTMGWTLKFESYNDEFYSIKITMTDGEMWGANANYNDTEKSCTVYLPKSTLEGTLDENGCCYVLAAGFPSGANPALSIEVKVNDKLYRDYIASEDVKNTYTLVEAYKTAVDAITDADSYDTAMAAREAALEAVAKNLRARELAELNLVISAADAKIASSDDIVNIVKRAVYDKLDAAADAYKALTTDPKTNLTSESLAAAKALRVEAKDEYAKRKDMLSEEVKADIDEAIEALKYQHQYCTSLLWITDYERKIDALDVTQSTIVDDIVAVKAYREGYESSTAYTNITTKLTETDKATLEAAIAACDAEVVEIETVLLPELKESYVKAMEDKIALDLTIKANLDDAKSAYADIATYVTITEEDGELYTRYVAGYNTIKAACEAFVKAQITEVSGLLDEKYTILDDFEVVREKFNAIKLDYLMEENSEIAESFAAVQTKISANIFYYISEVQIPTVEWNKKGLAMESTVEFPARLNYNRKLNLKDGVEIVVELTSAAFYNDGNVANNLCFNLLSAPNSYKSMSDGISVVIWLFATESNVQIYNNNDVCIASAVMATPTDGGNITISAKYEEYYSFVEDATYWAYVIKVNEAEIVLTEEALTSTGYTISDDVYFSMGSFADDKSTPNILTLVSVNGTEFGMPEDKPVCDEHVDEDGDGKCDVCGEDVEINTPDDPNEPNDPVTPDEPTEPDDKGDDEELSFIQKVARFFRSLFDTVKNFFSKLFGKVE